MIFQVSLFLILSFVPVESLYRVQKVAHSIPHNSNDQNPSLRVSAKFNEQVAQGSSCTTGCPGCDVTAGTTGTVMSAPVTLYHIYIGHAATDYAPGVKFRTILDSLATGLQNTPRSPYMNILSGYVDTHGNTASKQFTFGGSYVYTYSSTAMSATIVGNAIGAAISDTTSGIKMDTTAIYTVFFRGDSSYCFNSGGSSICWGTNWCGYHSSVVPTGQTKSVIFSTLGDTTYGTVTGCSGLFPPTGYYYGFSANKYLGVVAPLTTCIDSVTSAACTYGQTTTCTYCYFTPPNGDYPSDRAISIYIHEVVEAISDGLGGFYVRDSLSTCRGSENGDLCLQSYSGITPSSSTGSYNLQLSNGNGGYSYFMTQDNFDHTSKTCSNGIPYPAVPTSQPVTVAPTQTSLPTQTAAPTNTLEPTTKPSFIPTFEPSAAPTNPTAEPINPSIAPTSPTYAPTTPTARPTAAPIVPSYSPTSPTAAPIIPSAAPSVTPSVTPSKAPSVTPSVTPSNAPVVTPSATPSVTPSTAPSNAPVVTPSVTPSVVPSTAPSNAPVVTPSVAPSVTPSVSPSVAPVVTPSATPSVAPIVSSKAPSVTPSVMPSATPSKAPIVTTNAPLKSTSSPSKPTVTPSAAPVTGSPVKSTTAPVKSTAFPSKPTVAPSAAPVSTSGSPVKSTVAPVKTSSAPVKTSSAPVKSTIAPVKASSAPLKATAIPS